MVVLNSFKRLLPVGGPHNAPTAENHTSLLVMVVSESFASRQLRLPKPGKGSLDHPAPAAVLHVPTNGYMLSGSRLGATADAGLTVGAKMEDGPRTFQMSTNVIRWARLRRARASQPDYPVDSRSGFRRGATASGSGIRGSS